MTQTSNAPTIKAAIIDALREAPGMGDVSVGYSWSAKMGRECIYGGSISVTQKVSSGRDDEGNATRDETAIIDIHVRVGNIGEDNEAAETRAVEIGAALEAYLAVHTPSVPGLLAIEVGGYALASSFDDQGAFALALYPVRADSYLS